MSQAGYVLTGGLSRRMGRDKAQLPYRRSTLVEYVAGEVEAAAGCAFLVGGGRQGRFLAIPDLYPAFGPVGAIATALAHSDASLNLIVACDMPAVRRGFLAAILESARAEACDALVPETPDGRLHPLCGVYKQEALGPFRRAVEQQVHTVREVLATIRTARLAVPFADVLANVNTPEEWEAFRANQE